MRTFSSILIAAFIALLPSAATAAPAPSNAPATAPTHVPSFTYPHDGQPDVYASNPFTWTTSPAAEANYLVVGTNAASADLVNSGVLPGNQ